MQQGQPGASCVLQCGPSLLPPSPPTADLLLQCARHGRSLQRAHASCLPERGGAACAAASGGAAGAVCARGARGCAGGARDSDSGTSVRLGGSRRRRPRRAGGAGRPMDGRASLARIMIMTRMIIIRAPHLSSFGEPDPRHAAPRSAANIKMTRMIIVLRRPRGPTRIRPGPWRAGALAGGPGGPGGRGRDGTARGSRAVRARSGEQGGAPESRSSRATKADVPDPGKGRAQSEKGTCPSRERDVPKPAHCVRQMSPQ